MNRTPAAGSNRASSNNGGLLLSRCKFSTVGMARVCARFVTSADGESVALRLFLRVPKRQRLPPAAAIAPAAASSGVCVCFDLSYSDIMGGGEANALAAQLMMCYAHNKKLPAPLQLAIANIGDGGSAAASSCASASGTSEGSAPPCDASSSTCLDALHRFGWESWRVDRERCPPAVAYAGRENVYYLSADADEDLPAVIYFSPPQNAAPEIGPRRSPWWRKRHGQDSQRLGDTSATAVSCLPPVGSPAWLGACARRPRRPQAQAGRRARRRARVRNAQRAPAPRGHREPTKTLAHLPRVLPNRGRASPDRMLGGGGARRARDALRAHAQVRALGRGVRARGGRQAEYHRVGH